MNNQKENEFENYYPKLKLRLLYYLRKNYDKKEFIYFNDLIEKFNKSKSSISQNLKILKDDGLISKHYVRTININDPYLIISITEKGLSLVNKILYEGLNNEEIKKLKKLKNN